MTINSEQIQVLRDKFEAAVMERICISKSTLIGLRTDDGYRNSTLSGHDYQGDWEFFLAGYSCSLAERAADKALIAEQAKRIAELEARTFTVKLPDYRDTYKENFAYEIEHHVRIELEKLARAAGITLKVGGEDAQS